MAPPIDGQTPIFSVLKHVLRHEPSRVCVLACIGLARVARTRASLQARPLGQARAC